MREFGGLLANAHKSLGDKKCVVYLCGDLGSGKTTLARGLLQAYNYSGKIKSPTFTIVETYSVRETTIYHFDLYRLNDPMELELIGARDYFSTEALHLIEWPEKAMNVLPQADLICSIDFVPGAKNKRAISLQAMSKTGEIIKNTIKNLQNQSTKCTN